MKNVLTQFRRLPHPRGFTLVEVLISIGIALFLILGISQIFSLAQQSTGAGLAMINAGEGCRTVQHTLTSDMRTLVDGSDMPALVIYSAAIPAYRNAVDKAQDIDGDNSTTNSLLNNGTSDQQYSYQVNERVHRIDKLCYFCRNTFQRQTADGVNLVSGTTSSEAFVWLGHLTLPNNTAIKNWTWSNPGTSTAGAWYNPGDPGTAGNPDDNNVYSSSWMLGRQVILLKSQATGEVEYPAASPTVAPFNSYFDPLSLQYSQETVTSPAVQLASSRYDLAQTSVSSYAQWQAAIIAAPPSGTKNWPYWDYLCGLNTNPKVFGDYRYQANPYPVKPGSSASYASWMSAISALMSPVFIKNCSQFIVEYAGDFVSQDPTSGQVLSASSDGQIDYTVDPDTGAHKIRWYGYPRNPSGEVLHGTSQQYIGVVPTVTGTFGTVKSVQYGVCPLRDTMVLATSNNATVYPYDANWGDPPNAPPTKAAGAPSFERRLPTTAVLSNYAGAASAAIMKATKNTESAPYVCAWGQDTTTVPKPKMLRITFAIDDPAGRLNTSQLYEYVFTLP